MASRDYIRTIVNRRLVTVVFSVILLAIGIFSFKQLPIEPYPGVAPLTVQIITQWPGRSTSEVEQQITIPLENASAGIAGTKSFRSVSLFGLSVVTLKFNEGTDPFRARKNVESAMNAANLPVGVAPALSPNSDATGEVMRYIVTGNGVSITTLKTIQDWEVYKRLKQVDGVAEVSSFGGEIRQYQVIPSPSMLQHYGLTLQDVLAAVTRANNNVGGGLMSSGEQQFVVRGQGLLQTIDDIRNVVITAKDGTPVKVGDIAKVKMGNVERLGMVKFNEMKDVVEGVVMMRRGENAAEVLARVRERVKEINDSGVLSDGAEIRPFYDRQNLLDMTTNTVKHTLFLGMSLVLIVLYVFLGNVRAALIVAAVIPLSLCFSFLMMYLFNVPANLISLGAIDFGVVVDSAVIVMENIMSQLEHTSTNVRKTVISATSNVMRAMIFSTMIIIVAYSPLFLIGGVEGIIFKPMAFTMGFALLSAIVLSLSFVPAVTSYVFHDNGEKPHHPPIVEKLLNFYKPKLLWVMGHKSRVLGMTGGLFVASILCFASIGTEFLPSLEENNLWLRMTLPNTVDLKFSSEMANKFQDFLREQPEIADVSVQIGRPDDGTDSTGVFNQEYGLYFKKPEEWPKGSTKQTLMDRIYAYKAQIPGAEINISQYIKDNVDEALSGVKGENSVKLFGPDLFVLAEKARQIETELKKVEGIADVGVFDELGQPTLSINIDRAKAARYGINLADVQSYVQYAIGGAVVSDILEGERKYTLAVRYPIKDRADPNALSRILINAPDGSTVPLGMIAEIDLKNGPFFIYREGGSRYIAIKFSVRGRDLGSAAHDAQKLVQHNINIPQGYNLVWDGQFNQMKQSQRKLAMIIPATLLVIFALLYATFGKAKDSFVVLLNVPFAAIGGIFTLKLCGETLSVSAAIGFLSLFGIAIQDGVILISQITRHYESTRSSLYDSIIDGCMQRMRPVLMTALLAGLGLLPAALSHEVGSEAQRPLALVIVGGMVTTTLLTLFVLPVIYSLANRHRIEEG